jgi:hypothetical protein
VIRAERAVGVLALAAAVVWWLLVPSYPNYDAYYHLVWGRELLDGLKPSFEAYAAPTEHPLYVAWCALLGLVGEHADRLLVLSTLLSLIALAWGTWRLALAIFGPWPALLATAFVGSSFAFLLYAVRAYVDVPFLALVVWAAALETQRRRGAPALLALAGLLRPEGWILAGLLWLWRGHRPRELGWVLVAPVLWCLVDLWVTGDPLHSVSATSALAEDLGRERGVGKVPRLFVTQLADVARPPVALAGVIGAVLAVRELGWRRVALPLGMLAAGVLAFTGTGVLGLSILPRYLTVPAVALCIFAGYAVAGFTLLPAGHPWRRPWGRGAVLAVVVGVAFLIVKLGSFGTLADELRFGRDIHDDLEALVHDRSVQADLRCGPLTFPNYRMVPDARWMLDAPRSAVGARSARRRAHGVAVFTIGRDALRRYGFADGASPLTNVPDPGYAPLVRTGMLSAYSSC